MFYKRLRVALFRLQTAGLGGTVDLIVGSIGSVQGSWMGFRLHPFSAASVAGRGNCGHQPGGEPKADSRAEVADHTRAAGVGRGSSL